MAAKLKSYTIVPDSLYVERKADIQLHSIVEAMQRPGYVLVSRQMGKTNLLLRAKRRWENTDDLYVYIDMSNIDETERECFESLIDTAIDTHEDILSSVREKIMDMRRVNIMKSPVQAHNEELRVLLKAIKGKLVFILDEIDSLTRTDYSDNVFSQIRSVYFSRVNYPVLEKLTYVLSGVVEPTEIIKNPKISPFNIGEKILLDDFTHEEYQIFIRKAELLEWGEETIERIYYWTGGNPRITWDICYELQNKEEKSAKAVDNLVKEMYLTSFDKAPVDTIRSLVKEDRDLRDAIIQLAYDKGNTLSDKIKSKLYLAGIVNYSDNDVRIKNRIIKESLSLSWLQKVEEEEKGLLTYAIELHLKGFYQESINKFESYLKNNDFPEANAPFYYYYMGSCFYHLKEFEQSLNYLTLKPLDKVNTPYEYRHSCFMAGADCLKLGRYQDSLEHFKKAMSGDLKDWVYYSAWINSLTARQRTAKNDENEIKEIENEYSELLALPNESGYEDIKLYAAIELAAMYRTTDIQKARDIYDEALDFTRESAKLRILVEKIEVVSEDSRQSVLDEIIDAVEKVQEVLTSLDPDNSLDIDEDIFTKVCLLVYLYDYRRWDVIRKKLKLLPYSYGDALYHIFLQVFTSTNHFGDGASRLIKELHDNIKSKDYELSDNLILPINKYNAFFNFDTVNSSEYLLLLKESNEKIDTIGLVVVRSYVWTLLEVKQYHSIIHNLDWIIERYSVNMPHADMANRSLIDYSLLLSYYHEGDVKSVLDMGRMILSYIDEEIPSATGRTRDNLKQIKQTAKDMISSVIPQEPIRNTKTYGRNEKVKVKYLNKGIIEVKKYKLVESDLQKGICVIVEE